MRYDVVVIGATPGGIAAAVAAARAGCSVGVFEPSSHLGGVVAGGLTATDYGDRRTIGGIAREFFRRIREYYEKQYGPGSPQTKACNRGFWFEPHVAEKVFREMLDSAGHVDLFLKHTLLSVNVEEARIVGVELRDDSAGEQLLVAAEVFIDALYEGDLMALARVPYRVGREGAYEFDEPHAGARPGEPEPEGTGDLRVQAYNYRLCLTDDPDRRVLAPEPPGYHREDYATLEAFLRYSPRATFAKHCVSTVPMPNRKVDANNGVAWQSTDLPGVNYAYPLQSWTRRKEIADQHRRYILGLLYFLQNDPQVPEAVRAEAREWGLAQDEFADNDNWPYALYVREARRMVGQYIFTEHDATTKRFKDDSIGLGSYAIDSHAVRRVPRPDGTFRATGGLWVPVDPYEIPYGVIIPREVRNLLVAVCVSATHVGYCTLRMEPVYMILGQACGEAAAMACEQELSVQEIEVAELQRRLLAAGQLIRANRRPVADFRLRSPEPLQAGEPIEFEDASTDEDGEIVEWRWDFDGDGVIDSTQQHPSFAFPLAREYEVVLMVRDDYGDVSLPAKKRIHVTGGPPGVPDLLLDNGEADLMGDWRPSQSSPGFVGENYLHDGDRNKGQSKARYVFQIATPGHYDVAISFPPYRNRATNVPVRIRYAEGEAVVEVNQRKAPATPPFQTIGRYVFRPGAPALVEIENTGTDGFVIADAVRLRYQSPLMEGAKKTSNDQ